MHLEKFAWAVGILDGARRLADDNSNRIPLFLLLGLSVENALKVHLEKKGEPPSKWERSHDLTDLYDKASAAGLAPIEGVETFVRALLPPRKEFVSRYPEKAGIAELFSPASSIHATDELCRAVAQQFDPGEIPEWTAKLSTLVTVAPAR